MTLASVTNAEPLSLFQKYERYAVTIPAASCDTQTDGTIDIPFPEAQYLVLPGARVFLESVFVFQLIPQSVSNNTLTCALIQASANQSFATMAGRTNIGIIHAECWGQ